ncbi:MAG: hypothetical protein EHM79_18675 [Geobacter sp.]|nr:MAG: hypothetical protein EHM79_18675 [Geobacter sp.]
MKIIPKGTRVRITGFGEYDSFSSAHGYIGKVGTALEDLHQSPYDEGVGYLGRIRLENSDIFFISIKLIPLSSYFIYKKES